MQSTLSNRYVYVGDVFLQQRLLSNPNQSKQSMSSRSCSIHNDISSFDHSSHLGYFAFVYLNENQMKTFQLNIKFDQIDRVNEQCLIYYYYMSNTDEKMIVIRKEESNGQSEVIDSVRNSSFNGWIQRKVSFNAQKADYKVRYLTKDIIVELIFLANI